MPPPIGIPTPEQLLAEAEATALLARHISYQKDKDALIEQAEKLRQRAQRLRRDNAGGRLQ